MTIRHTSSPDDKVSLFRGLFSGRTDVYPRQYETRDGRVGYSPV